MLCVKDELGIHHVQPYLQKQEIGVRNVNHCTLNWSGCAYMKEFNDFYFFESTQTLLECDLLFVGGIGF
jgi:hypothetical protein